MAHLRSMNRTFKFWVPVFGFVSTAAVGCADDEKSGPAPVEKSEYAGLSADSFCGPFYNCNCGSQANQPYGTEEACNATLTRSAQEGIADADQAGLIYSAQCAGADIAAMNAIGCDRDSIEWGSAECSVCNVFYGDKPDAAQCEVFDIPGFGSPSNCVQGLDCIFGRCESPCAESGTQPGQPPGIGDSCVQDGYCDAIAYCDYDGYVCRALPELGESCSDAGWCAGGASCDYEAARCVAPAAAGESCDYATLNWLECEAGLLCTDGTCSTRAGAGQPCGYGSVCELELMCQGGTCGTPLQDGAACDIEIDFCNGYCDFGSCAGSAMICQAYTY